MIRHGTTEMNKKKKVNGQIDEPLAFEGIEETKLAIALIPQTITHIYTSSLLRARQTAEIFNATLHLPISVQEELAEIHMGSLAGKSWEEMEDGLNLKNKHRNVQFDYRPYGGESVEQVKKRLLTFFREINDKHGNHEVLIITHGGILRFIHLLEHGESPYETEKHVSPIIFDLDKILKNFEASSV